MICPRRFVKAGVAFLLLLLGVAGLQAQPPVSRTVTLSVVSSDAGLVGAYRYLVEEDRTYHVRPGVLDPNTLAVRFHASYMPVVDKGESNGAPVVITLPDSTKHYYVSVLPKTAGSYTIGGAPIAPGLNGAVVTVQVNKLPLPTAQITLFVFHDVRPINNIPDLPSEVGLGGFPVILEDAGGRYGIAAGTQTQDAFGNRLGTTYQKDRNGNFILDANGAPIVAVDNKGVPIVEPMLTGPCPGPTCGELNIKNLHPGKYGVIVVPPPGSNWIQTSTIEGTKVIDAWVKANEPAFFAEFGPPGHHVSIGFVQPFNDPAVLTGGVTVTGKIVNNHMSRPPDYAFYNGAPIEHSNGWIGLNDAAGAPGLSKGVFAIKANGDGTFAIPNIPPGTYQLVVWDDALDIVFAKFGFTVNPNGTCSTLGGSCNLGDVAVFQWFSRSHHYVFRDDGCAGTIEYNALWAEDGFRQPCEKGILNQAINIRWRDGTVNQSAPTDGTGFVPFDEVFPFFHWQVAEVDFTRFKPTGVTVTVDHGGPSNPADPRTFEGQLNPQIQLPGGLPYRTQKGPVLTQGFQGFLGQLNVFEWGKVPYKPGENGGIAGIVYYDTTRAENDPAWNFAEPWTPGIAGIPVLLYVRGATPGSLVAVAGATTDSWDATPPTGCQGEWPTFAYQGVSTDCYDGMRNFNQVRPGVFDGGYAFTECYVLGGKCVAPDPITGLAPAGAALGPLPAGEYFVKVVPPTGAGGKKLYEVVKEEDKNVDFGDNYVPSPNLVPADCEGTLRLVPATLSLFEGVPTFYGGQTRPLCDVKRVLLSNGSNAPADFFLFTEVPIAGHIVGGILDDTANEFDPTSPNFGEKYAPPFMPVSIRDWTGKEIARTYSDKFGHFNALVPSTYTKNRPSPSGVSPNMITTCMNARTKPDGSKDPWWNPQYSEFCYTFQYMPGTTTYLDTPVVPVAAFAGPNQAQLDCAFPTGTPRIKKASVNNGLHPSRPTDGGPLVTVAGQTIIIDAIGPLEVPNPGYCPGPPVTTLNACPVIDTQKTILRDYGFGVGGGTVTVNGLPLPIFLWSAGQITATVPAGIVTGQLVVNRGDNGKSSITGVTLTVGTGGKMVWYVRDPTTAPPGAISSIQTAIDLANEDDIILVEPATYREMVIMYKPVRLQGYGEGSTTIDAVKVPAEKLTAWRLKVDGLVAQNLVTLLPGQEVGAVVAAEPVLLFPEEGAGILVLPRRNRFKSVPNARIDGFTVTGADTGGGIIVNGYADYLEISNNKITNNNGFYGGGIRVGHPALTTVNGQEYTDAENNLVRIHNNQVSLNGGLGGAGGGISLCTGSDLYQVTANFVCGNFTMRDGGGIGHLGLSNNGLIAGNTIIFNENFNQGIDTAGGGISVAGQPPLLGQAQSPGSGSVKIDGNLIQGNLAGAGDGGGIRLSRINGNDVASNRNQPLRWFGVDIINNIIVNNVAGLAGGGISISDAVNVKILHNTIASNDSTATAGQAFTPGVPNQSNPQPAGVVTYAHSTALRNTNLVGTYANPNLQDNIIWNNRSFRFKMVPCPGDPRCDPANLNQDQYVVEPAPQPINDLAVLGVPAQLNPQYNVLTNTAGYLNNILSTGDPGFVWRYENGQGGTTVGQPEATTAITPPPAFDEGGNFIKVRYGPLSLSFCTVWTLSTCTVMGGSNYHLLPNSIAIDGGVNLNPSFPGLGLAVDFDRQPRPGVLGGAVDIGADEIPPLPAVRR
jgi:hypothetical protein